MRAFLSPLPPDCEEIVIARDRLMLVLPAGHQRCPDKKISLSAIADEDFVALGCKGRSGVRGQIMNLWEKSGLKPHLAQEAENGPAVMPLVAAGLGNAVLPSSLQALRFDHIVWKTIDVDERWTETSLNLVYHKDALSQRASAAFIACLRRHSSSANVVRPFD
jgi:DNA-binding transcriptional LysR family regulator